MQPSLSHTQKYHSFNAHPLLLNRKREKTAGSLRLIFKWFRWIPAHALHTEEKLRISQRTWPADPVASTPLSIPQHPHTHPPTPPPHHRISQPNPAFLHKAWSAPKHFCLHALFIFHNMNITSKSVCQPLFGF